MKEIQKQIMTDGDVMNMDQKSDYEKRCFLAETMARTIGPVLAGTVSEETIHFAEKGLQILLDDTMQ